MNEKREGTKSEICMKEGVQGRERERGRDREREDELENERVKDYHQIHFFHFHLLLPTVVHR